MKYLQRLPISYLLVVLIHRCSMDAPALTRFGLGCKYFSSERVRGQSEPAKYHPDSANRRAGLDMV